MPSWRNTGGTGRKGRSRASCSAAGGCGGGSAGAQDRNTHVCGRSGTRPAGDSRGRLYSRGAADKGGNQNLRLALARGGGFTLAAAISHLSEKTGHSTYKRCEKVQERGTYSEAPRVTGRLWVPRKYEALLWDLVLSGRPYTVELLRGAPGRWRAHVSFTPTATEPACGLERGTVGLDMNPHVVAVASTGRDGNPQPWPEGLAERLRAEAASGLHKFDGELQVGAAPGRIWLHAPEMWQAGADRRAYLSGVVAKLAVDAAREAGKPLAREDLGFSNEHDDGRPTAFCRAAEGES